MTFGSTLSKRFQVSFHALRYSFRIYISEEHILDSISRIDASRRRQPLGRPPDDKDSPMLHTTVNLSPTKPIVLLNTENGSDVCPKKGPADVSNSDVRPKKGPADKNPDVLQRDLLVIRILNQLKVFLVSQRYLI